MQQDLNEKLIVFGGGAKYGQIVFMAGGAGSGKGFVQSNFMEGEKFKVRDVDAYKAGFLKLAQFMDKYSELKGLDLRKPGDVFALHAFVKRLNVSDKMLNLLLQDMINNASSVKGTLPNILFDITAKSMNDITDVTPYLIHAGYDPKSIHIVWVLTDYKVAIQNNAGRSRVVPEDILLLTHRGAADTMKSIIHGNIPRGVDGRIVVVLNNPQNTVWERKANKELKVAGVVKSFMYIEVKKPGAGVEHTLDIRRELFKWIAHNVPPSLED